MLFGKGKQRQSCEVREESLWYELIITEPSGKSRVERYTERANRVKLSKSAIGKLPDGD